MDMNEATEPTWKTVHEYAAKIGVGWPDEGLAAIPSHRWAYACGVGYARGISDGISNIYTPPRYELLVAFIKGRDSVLNAVPDEQTRADLPTVAAPRRWRPCARGCPGWGVFNEGLEIQRCDECNRFESDEDAAAHAFALEKRLRDALRENRRMKRLAEPGKRKDVVAGGGFESRRIVVPLQRIPNRRDAQLLIDMADTLADFAGRTIDVEHQVLALQEALRVLDGVPGAAADLRRRELSVRVASLRQGE